MIFITLLSMFLQIASPAMADSAYDRVRLSVNMPDHCAPISKSLWDTMIGYTMDSFYNHKVSTKHKFDLIKKTLREETLAQSGCAKSVSVFYALASIELLSSGGRIPLKERTPYANYIEPHYLDVAHLLAKADRLIPLTSDKRRRMGGIFKRETILGGYSCKSSAVYFDPSLPPFDLGAVLVHEMSHVLRDKLGVDPRLSPTDLRDYLIKDEFLATLRAALMQLRMDQKLGESDYKYPHRFSFAQDRTLFSRRGVLVDLWLFLGFGVTNAYQTGKITFVNGRKPLDERVGDGHDSPHDWFKTGEDFEEALLFGRTRQGEQFWDELDAFSMKRSSLLKRLLWQIHVVYFGAKSMGDLQFEPLNPNSLAMIDLNKASETCERLHVEHAEGRLTDYLGSGPNTRGGEEGVKYVDALVRPCARPHPEF